MAWLMPVLSTIGSVFSGLMGFKGAQAEVVNQALKTLGDVSQSNTSREQAIAMIIAAEANSESWLVRNWRPLLMYMFIFIIGSYWFFGYVPPHFNAAMSPMMQEIFELLKIGLMGYIPARTIDKIVQNINMSRVLQSFIDKKVV